MGPAECGEVPEGSCPCVRVAPDGDDDRALSNDGATPFARISTATEFATNHRPPGASVCVAAGDACGRTATYEESLWIEAALAVRGNYESTGWKRCADSLTRIRSTSFHGFEAVGPITGPVLISGFTIEGSSIQTDDLPLVLSGVRLLAPLFAQSTVLITESDIEVNGPVGVTLFEPNSLLEDVRVHVENASGDAVAISLLDADDTTITDSEIEVSAASTAAAVRARSLTGLELENDAVTADGDRAEAVECSSSCDMSMKASEVTARGRTYAQALMVTKARVDGSVLGASTSGERSGVTTVYVQAELALTGSDVTATTTAAGGLAGGFTGLACDGSCELRRSRVRTPLPPLTCETLGGCPFSGPAVKIQRGLADGNSICGGVQFGSGTLRNNFIWADCGRDYSGVALEVYDPFASSDLPIVESNTISGSDAIRLRTPGFLRSNITRASSCHVEFASGFFPQSSIGDHDFDPEESNAFLCNQGFRVTDVARIGTYVIAGTNHALDPRFVDPPRDLHLMQSSPLRDLVRFGQNVSDFDGDARSVPYDVGADEVVP